MTDPIPRAGDGDPAIEHATEQVAASWQDATPGKEPDADAEDFERMREGFGQLAEQGTDGESRTASGRPDLADAAERGTRAGGEDPSAG